MAGFIDRNGGSGDPGLAARVGAAARLLASDALDWLYPPRCLACDMEAAEIGGLCGPCWRDTVFLDADVCPRCGAPAGAGLDPALVAALARPALAGDGAGPQLCPDCPTRPTAWARARAATLYGGAARSLTLALKEGDRLDAARWMGRSLAIAARRVAEAAGILDNDAPPLLTPVPLHWRRRVMRGGNQAAALAAATAAETGWPACYDALRRRRATDRLASLAREDRAKAIDGAFEPGRGAALVEGRAVILIDDVMTTGVTLDAAARALRAMGAASVDAAVYARAATGKGATSTQA